MNFYNEAKNLPAIWEALAISLFNYASVLFDSKAVWENEQWVFRPENFVTFRIHHKRKINITLYLRGYESEFLQLAGKTVCNAVPAYSKIIISNYAQAFEAFAAINRAYSLYLAGRDRPRKSLRLVEGV